MSYKIVDQIAKSPIPSTLKTVLIAYATFANRDGTSIRPTEAKVALRASSSRSVVSRHTQTLVALGLLVHDRDEHGIFLKHAYGDNGVWAYVYHIDASKLTDPLLVARWEAEREAFIEKCRVAGAKNFATRWAKGTSGNRSGLSKIQQQEQRDLRQTQTEGFATNPPQRNPLVGAEGFATQTLPSDPRSANPTDNPSAVSTAVNQNQVSELVSEASSVASLPHSGDSATSELTFDQEKQGKPEWTNADIDREIGPSQQWLSAEDLYHRLFPRKLWTDADIELLIALATEVGGFKGITYGAERLVAAWEWNQVHKKGKYKLFSLAELAKSLRSTNDRSLLAQMEAHEGCKLCEGICEQDKDNTNSRGMDTPPASAPPPSGSEGPCLCPHGNNWGFCQPCTDKEALRNQCQHGNHTASCYECSHPPNTTCRWKKCGKWFHAESKAHHFCSPECEDKFKAREAEMKALYASEAVPARNQLAAFLDGEY